MFDPQNYPPPIQQVLSPHDSGERLMPLAPRGPLRGEALAQLAATGAAQLVSPQSLTSRESGNCVRSALFLYLSALDHSHKISQNIPSATGSFLHGIMHRQEPDYPNSKYWFRRVGDHELFPPLRESTLELLGQGEATSKRLRDEVERRPAWDPYWFVDQCELASGGGELVGVLEQIQLLEWQLLFDYCYSKAVG
jgi:hypothetical protein